MQLYHMTVNAALDTLQAVRRTPSLQEHWTDLVSDSGLQRVEFMQGRSYFLIP